MSVSNAIYELKKISKHELATVKKVVLKTIVTGRCAAEKAADLFGFDKRTVHKWLTAFEKGGTEALLDDRRGRPVGTGCLLQEEMDRIREIVANNTPDQCDLPFLLWTREAVANLIENEFGVKLSVRRVGEILRELDFTFQKPWFKAEEQNPEEVREWTDKKIQEIQLRSQSEGVPVLWLDETGIHSTHNSGKSWAPIGKTPEIRVSSKRHKVNMISTVRNNGEVNFFIFTGKFNWTVYTEFLDKLCRDYGRKIFVVVDNHRSHTCAAALQWLEENKDRIEVFYLPKYSPELNPDELLNGNLKVNLFKKRRPKDRDDLAGMVDDFMKSVGDKVASFFQKASTKYADFGPA